VLGAVIVSTPQDVALLDVVRGVNMFRKVNVPVSMQYITSTSLSISSFVRDCALIHFEIIIDTWVGGKHELLYL
jgi:hypothetical protein